jgi:hypothetical protein
MTTAARQDLALLRQFLPAPAVNLTGFLRALNPGHTWVGRRALAAIVAELSGAIEARREDLTVSVLKGAQVGLSSAALGLALYLPLQAGASCGYFLPTDRFAARFHKTRLRPLLQAASLGQDDAPVHSRGLVGVGSAFLYLLGLTSINNAVSIPLDASLYDEVDILPADNLTWSEDRIAASQLRLRLFFSVGMRPGAGIDARFEGGTGSLWVVKCPGCGREHVLEERFPSCLAEGPDGARLVCPACTHALDADAGTWVDSYPARRQEGRLSFRLPQLAVPALSLAHIAGRHREALSSRRLMSRFRCSVLALPDGGDLSPLDARALAAARGDHLPAQGLPPHGVARFGGVDCGDAAHLAVAEWSGQEADPVRFVHFEELDSDHLVERVNVLWERLDLSALVIDAKPLRATARKLAYAHPERVWLQDFGPEGGPLSNSFGEHQGKRYQRVVVPREESLADLIDGLLSGRVLLPRQDSGSPRVLAQVDAHLMALRQEKVIDARGNTVHRFTRGVPNHFAMAMNSALVACRLAAGLLSPAQVETTGVRRTFINHKGGF